MTNIHCPNPDGSGRKDGTSHLAHTWLQGRYGIGHVVHGTAITHLQLVKGKRLEMLWVTGHVAVAGNERADKLSKFVSEFPPWDIMSS
jgi:ribonuclease HI